MNNILTTCPQCGSVKGVERCPTDPSEAVLVELLCGGCGGNQNSPIKYYDKDNKLIRGMSIESNSPWEIDTYWVPDHICL